MNYSKWNTRLGWGIFTIATIVYLLTIEETVSLWDCGEYITAAYKLEVGHPPGAPLFMLLGRLFSFYAAPENVAVWINSLSAISSSMTILFMFWTLTLLLKKLTLRHKKELSEGDKIAVFSAAAIGALSYTFSDSFWFSAVEGEVYAMASLFTAIVFWAALKWDEEMMESEANLNSGIVIPNKWLLLIMFLLGLAIGVHLLCILVIPSICFMVYFRVRETSTAKGIILTSIIAIFTLGFIQVGVIPGTISLASSFEVMFVNSFGAPFFSGTIFFFLFLVGLFAFLILYARKKEKTILYNSTMGMLFLLIGYGSFAVIVIRSNANTPLDENNPENLVTLRSYLNREQYGSVPLLKGQYWNSYRLGEVDTEDGPQLTSKDGWGDLSPNYTKRFVVQEDGEDVKGFEKKKDAQKWAASHTGSYEIKEKYFESNSSIRKGAVAAYSQETIFPRMHSEGNGRHQQGYENWSGYDANEDKGTDIGRDGRRLPTFLENLTFFFRYQVNWMYIRYFMWNFAGRQNDIQGHGDNMRGNWLSGFDIIDTARLGSQEFAPHYSTENPSHNRFFLLPLTFALIGIFFHFYRAPKDALIILLAFLFTGLAILVYLNQKPLEPRERDYAYAGSFYFFAMWIGIGVYALYDAVMRFKKEDLKKIVLLAGIALAVTIMIDVISEEPFVTTLTCLFISVMVLLLVGGAFLLRNRIKSENTAAITMALIGLCVPVIMGTQGWDDHNRSGKTSARDLAYNYLMSCQKNGILFTNGDNDTFPLWYMQEVEGVRTDVRVCNLSLMGTDWYTNQMKMKAYKSEALPIKFREDQILMYAGNTDQIYFIPLLTLYLSGSPKPMIEKVISMRLKNNPKNSVGAIRYFNAKMTSLLPGITLKNQSNNTEFDKIKADLLSVDTTNLLKNVTKKYDGLLILLQGAQKGSITMDEKVSEELKTLLQDFEKPWRSCDFSEAMAFTRDDDNVFVSESGDRTTFFPSSRFTLKVNKNNAISSGVINTAMEKDSCPNKIEFEFNSEKDPALTRDEIMMMDIVANNDWKRGIYFSSSRGSSFALALLSSGYVKQVGMAYELSPIRVEPNFYNIPKMFKNLTKTYSYGKMNKKNVLTDYYARRHTLQYRVNFLLLAEQYHKMGMNSRAIELLDFSLNKMPLENVLDVGEVSGFDPMSSLSINAVHQKFSFEENERPMCSGTLHEYVQLYFLAGNKKKGEALGLKLIKNYESIFNYFKHTDVLIGAKPDNVEDLFAALDACFKIRNTIQGPQGNKSSVLAFKINAAIQSVYRKIIPKMMNSLEQLASDNNEAALSGMGKYGSLYASLVRKSKAIGEHYGYLPKPIKKDPVKAPDKINLDNINLNSPIKTIPK
jgi:hypothetical protein